MTGRSCPGSGRARISSRLPRTAWNWQQGLAVAVIVGDVERSGPDRRIRSCDVKRRGEARVAIPERVAKFFVERSEEHTSELQSLMRISYAVFCLKKKTNKKKTT